MMQPNRLPTPPARSRASSNVARTSLRALVGMIMLVVLAACGTQTPPVEETPLTLTDISPTSGDFTTDVVITGENIAGDATVLVCGEEATDVVVRNADGIGITGDALEGVTIEFNPPVLTTDGECEVVVSQGEGDAAESESLTFTYEATDTGALTLGDVNPESGAEGNTVTVTGVNIAGDATVTICGAPATNVTVLDENDDPVAADAANGVAIQFDVPAGLTDGECDIVVSQGEGDTLEEATLTAAFTHVTPTEPGDAIRINAGGPAVVTTGGVTWQADTYATDGGTYGPVDEDIVGTEDDEIYQTERDGFLIGDVNDPADDQTVPFSYVIPVENGEYTVVLHFAELFIGTDATGAEGTGVGSREFDVSIEGNDVLDNFDIYDESAEDPAEGDPAGAPYVAVTREFAVAVTDDELEITFTPVAGMNAPMVNAIEVLPAN